MLYSQLKSQMTLDPSAGTSDTQYEAPRASSYDTPSPSTRVPETQAPADARHERARREIRPRDTYNPSLIRRIFSLALMYFFISETIVYILFYSRACILFSLFMI
jgi:hypothetical protein